MSGQVFLYGAALLVSVWGVAHLVPTRSVVASFGAISSDNRLVLTMEWVAEAVTMLFVGVLVAAVTLIDSEDGVALAVYLLSATALGAIAVLTALTGARTPVVWFKACPLVMATCIVLILLGSAL